MAVVAVVVQEVQLEEQEELQFMEEQVEQVQGILMTEVLEWHLVVVVEELNLLMVQVKQAVQEQGAK
jgi:hypothetical protein